MMDIMYAEAERQSLAISYFYDWEHLRKLTVEEETLSPHDYVFK